MIARPDYLVHPRRSKMRMRLSSLKNIVLPDDAETAIAMKLSSSKNDAVHPAVAVVHRDLRSRCQNQRSPKPGTSCQERDGLGRKPDVQESLSDTRDTEDGSDLHQRHPKRRSGLHGLGSRSRRYRSGDGVKSTFVDAGGALLSQKLRKACGFDARLGYLLCGQLYVPFWGGNLRGIPGVLMSREATMIALLVILVVTDGQDGVADVVVRRLRTG